MSVWVEAFVREKSHHFDGTFAPCAEETCECLDQCQSFKVLELFPCKYDIE